MDASLLLSLAPLHDLANGHVVIAAAIFARLSAMFMFLPGIGERVMPVRVRLTAALALMLVLLPAVSGDIAAPQQPSKIAAMIGAEAVSGALIGFSIRIAIFAIQIAGVIASQSLSLAQLFGSNMSFEPETPISTMLMFAAIVMAVTAGVHFEAVSVLIISFDIIPLGQFPGASDTGEWAAGRAGFAFSAGLSLAFPFVVLGFIYNLAIGAANRAMPQLMVAFVGIPAVTLAGFALLAASAPVLLSVWLDLMRDIIREFLAQQP
jgi:flagellar biosynthetic protein FliR